MKKITREELRAWMEEEREFVLLETLPAENYEEAHLPGARHLPPDRVRELAGEVAPDRRMPVVVYCADAECQASPRSARVLDSLGYAEVYDYEEGKAGWRDAGLPVESGAVRT